MTTTKSSIEGELSVALQSAADTPNTTLFKMKNTRVAWTPDVVQDEEGEAEIGSGLDVSQAENYGHRGANVVVEGRARPGPMGFFLRGFGMSPASGGFILWTGVNETISVTDAGGGPTTVNFLTGSAAVSGTAYSGTELAVFMKVALDAGMAGTHTVTYDTSTKLFTIASDSGTFELHWTTTPMIGNLLGYDHSADDTGATSYVSDEAREVAGRWTFRDGRNEVIRVTDDGAVPADVDILSGVGYILAKRVPYNAWNVCGGLKATLDANTDLTDAYTVTYSATTEKFTIASDGAALTLHWSHVNCTIEDELGYSNAADDSGATTYTGDNAIEPACKHYFTPQASAADMLPINILDKMETTHALDTYLPDIRGTRFALDAPSRDVARFTFEGRALDYRDGYASGSGTGTLDTFTVAGAAWSTDQWKNFVLTDSAAATFVIASNTATVLTVTGTPASGAFVIAVTSETAQPTGLATPNTSRGDGQLYFGGALYKMNTLGVEFTIQETVDESLTYETPDGVILGRRAGRGTATIRLGKEASAGLFRATYYGSTTGVHPSTTMEQRALDVLLQSGADITTVGTTEGYGLRFEADECNLLTYPIEKTGDDPEGGSLSFQIAKESDDWGFTLVTSEDYLYGFFD